MRKLKIERFPPITLADIEHFEKTYKVKLPDDYKAFLLMYNGGNRPSPSYFDFDENGKPQSSAVHVFYGLGNLPNYAMLTKNFQLTVYEDWPEGIIAICGDHFGNEICISTRKADYGHIYFYDHDWEFSFVETETYGKSVFFVADSFTAFLDMLYESDEE